MRILFIFVENGGHPWVDHRNADEFQKCHFWLVQCWEGGAMANVRGDGGNGVRWGALYQRWCGTFVFRLHSCSLCRLLLPSMDHVLRLFIPPHQVRHGQGPELGVCSWAVQADGALMLGEAYGRRHWLQLPLVLGVEQGIKCDHLTSVFRISPSFPHPQPPILLFSHLPFSVGLGMGF